jgi:hypothetical protein
MDSSGTNGISQGVLEYMEDPGVLSREVYSGDVSNNGCFFILPSRFYTGRSHTGSPVNFFGLVV